MPRPRGRPPKEKVEVLADGTRIYENGVIEIPNSELETVDVSSKNLERIAQGFFVGSTAIGRKRDVRKILEDRVVGRIGRKGKHLVDKLFELIEGVYIVDKLKEGKNGEELRYYKVPPNLQAIIYALDRVLGKPKQVNITGSFSLHKLLTESQKTEPDKRKKELEYEYDPVNEGLQEFPE